MSFIFIAGMHEDWCRFSQSRLQEMGIAPISSETDKASGLQSYTQKLCKAHKVSTERSSKFRQVSPGKAWEITAASIIVENAENDNWCWGNPDNVFFLEFWKKLDPLCQFVLVYGSFADFRSLQSKQGASPTRSEDVLAKRWAAYHTEILLSLIHI